MERLLMVICVVPIVITFLTFGWNFDWFFLAFASAFIEAWPLYALTTLFVFYKVYREPRRWPALLWIALFWSSFSRIYVLGVQVAKSWD